MPRFFVVDDESDVGETFSQALRQSGVAVCTFTQGSAAIEAFRKERADLVFCDLKLPGLDGFEILSALKAIDPWATVILMSVYTSAEVVARAFRLGAYDYLEKPCNLTQIQLLISRALNYRRQLHELMLLQGRPGKAEDIPSRLTELEQLRTDFLELMVQELRSPLRLLSEELTLAFQGFYGSWSAEQRRFLDRSSRVQTQLSRLLTGSFALFLNHEQRLCPKEVDLVTLYRPLLEQAEGLCQSKGVLFKTALPTPSLTGLMDADKALQIAGELLDNAVRFTPSGGRVEFKLSAAGTQGFQLQVDDTGPGISAEQKPWLFTTYQALPREGRLNPWKKTCLGLALVRHYVDLLGGMASAEDRLGGGSSFRVCLPWMTPATPGA